MDHLAHASRIALLARHGWVLLLLTLLPLLLFSRAIHAPFVYDDRPAIVSNPSLRQLWPPLVPLWPARDLPTAGRPLVNYSFALNYHFGGLRPEPFRAVNYAIHIINAWLVYALLRHLFGLDSQPESIRGRRRFLALMVSLIWALHPLQTEAVVYVTQRTELMVSLFILGTLLAAIKGFAASNVTQRRCWLGLSVAACFLGTLCKELMVAAPLLVLIVDRVFFSVTWRELWRRHRGFYLGLWLSWIPVFLIVLSGPRTSSVGYRFGISAWEYLNTQAVVIMVYLRQVAWPDDLSIASLFMLRDFPRTVPIVIFLGLWLLAVLWAVHRRRWWGAAGMWFFVILGPSSSVVPIATELMAERRMYLPLLGLLVAVTVGMVWLIEKIKSVGIDAKIADLALMLIAGLLLIAALLGSVNRLAAWKDEETIWRDAVEKYPDNAWSNGNLASIYLAERKYPLVIAQYARVVRLLPGNSMCYLTFSKFLQAMGRRRQAQLLVQQALMIDPKNATAWDWQGQMLLMLKQPAQAIKPLRWATKLDPENPDAWLDLANAALATGDWQQAMDAASHSLKARRADTNALALLAIAQSRLGMHAQAQLTADHVMKLAPGNAESWLAMIEVAKNQHQPEQTTARYEAALRALPRSAAIRESYVDWLVQSDRLKDARALSIASYEIDHARFGYVLRIARISLEMGLLEDSLTACRAALARVVDNPTSLEELDQVLTRLSDKLSQADTSSKFVSMRTDVAQIRAQWQQALEDFQQSQKPLEPDSSVQAGM